MLQIGRQSNQQVYFKIMEKILTFALLNKFFIWVDAKILVNYNLNLLLTKYYKKVLKS